MNLGMRKGGRTKSKPLQHQSPVETTVKVRGFCCGVVGAVEGPCLLPRVFGRLHGGEQVILHLGETQTGGVRKLEQWAAGSN